MCIVQHIVQYSVVPVAVMRSLAVDSTRPARVQMTPEAGSTRAQAEPLAWRSTNDTCKQSCHENANDICTPAWLVYTRHSPGQDYSVHICVFSANIIGTFVLHLSLPS